MAVDEKQMCDKNKKDYGCLYFKAPGPSPGPQFVFTGPGPKFVFTGPGPQFVFTGPGPHLVFTPNLYLPAQPDA